MKTQYTYPNGRTGTFDDAAFSCHLTGGKNSDGSNAADLDVSYVVYVKETVQVPVLDDQGNPKLDEKDAPVTVSQTRDTETVDTKASLAKMNEALQGFRRLPKVVIS